MNKGIKFLISEAIVKVLNENRMEFLVKTFTGEDKKNPGAFKISTQQLLQILQADPTTRPEHPQSIKDVQKPGNYVQWLINMLRTIWPKKNAEGNIVFTKADTEKVKFFFEDIYRANEALKKFDIMKRKHLLPEGKKDINQIKTVDELLDVTDSFSLEDVESEKQAHETKKELAKDLKLQYEDAHWQVVTPMTYEASRTNFGFTRWCTAASEGGVYDGRYRYENYSKENPLYVVIDKSQPWKNDNLAGTPILQFHFGSSIQFKDIRDHEIDDVPGFFNTKPGMKKWIEPIIKHALAHREFNLTDTLWKLYAAMYGVTSDIKQMVEENLMLKVRAKDILVLSDSDGTTGEKVNNYLNFLGSYDYLIQKIFEFIIPKTVKIELKFMKYQGEGFHIPDKVGELVNCSVFVFSGFVKSVSPAIAKVPTDFLLCVDDNPHLTHLPDELCNSTIEALNIKKSGVQLSDCLRQKEAEGMLLIE
jgi:hypothetical protein